MTEQKQLPIVCAVEGCENPPAKSGEKTLTKCIAHLMGGSQEKKPVHRWRTR